MSVRIETTSQEPRLKVPDQGFSVSTMKIDRAGWAVKYFSKFDRDSIVKISDAVAKAAHKKAGHYADWAVRETGMGVVEHKKIKNELCCFPLLEYYKNIDLISPRVDAARKIVELPKPAGVIFALTPVTNPVSTIYYKTMLALLSRNAIVFSPHPGAKECSFDAALYLAKAAEEAGAPSGLIQCIEDPTVPLVNEIMASPRVNVIVATGGTAMVRAAYSSSNPAMGVGPGNAVAYIDPSANITRSAKQLVESNSFDNSVLCTNESVVLTLDSNRQNAITSLRAAKAHICTDEETNRLRDYLFPEGKFNISSIGKSAAWIAERAEIRANPTAKILVPVIKTPGQDDLLLREKLCPVLTLVSSVDFNQALALAKNIVKRGAGHSAAFHGEDRDHLLKFAQHVPAYRVVVNAPCSQGAAGFATNLAPSFTIGTGFNGRSSIGENLGPQHLVHWTSIAYSNEADVPFYLNDVTGQDLIQSESKNNNIQHTFMASSTHQEQDTDIDRDQLRQLIYEELKSLRGEQS